MARGDGRNGFGFDDRNRDGISDEIDRQPGNSGTSKEFAEKYDRRTEQEYSNLQETQNQLEQKQILRDYEEMTDALRNAQSDVHYFPSVGKFIIPKENTWAAHAELVKDDSTSLHFNPEKYVYFDKIIAEKFKNPALYDPHHPDYMKFEGLRTNIEVLRNDIIGIYLDDGAFDPGDEKHIPNIVSVATAIGEGLANDKWYKRPFVRSIGVDVANVEGVGAREIYKYLLQAQEPGARDTTLRNYITTTLHIPSHHWHLPPLSETPYSPEGLSAPPPIRGCPPSTIIVNSPVGTAPIQSVDATEQAVNRVERSVSIARRLRTPESLDVPTQEQSIDEARTILRYLKNLQFGDRPMEEWLDQGTPAEQQAKSEAVSRLIELYGGQLKIAAAKSSAIVNSMVVDSANQAAGSMALSVAGHTLDNLPDDHPRIITLEDTLTGLPAAWEQRQNHSVNRLLEMIETGIEWSSDKNVSDKPAAERLMEMSNRIQASARQLRSVETMEPPARIESVELAREILRKLKGMGFADKPLESFIAAPGSLEDKAAVAAQISEMVEMYRNVLAEAAEQNPDIMKDARVQEANEAVGKMSHTVKLMAAKEIPVSMAAAQQISADVTQDPEEWKRLSGQTVDRLVKSMEGGLEKAVADMQQQQEQAQQQDEELAKHSVENSLLGEAAGKRKRRRRRSTGGGKSGPSLTKSAKRRNATDLNGDGIADRLQNLGLNEKDLIAIRQLGGNLRNIGDQAAGMAPPAPPVEASPGLNPTPDEMGFAARKTERDRQNRQNRRPGSRNQQNQI